jgi:hypothetical protein
VTNFDGRTNSTNSFASLGSGRKKIAPGMFETAKTGTEEKKA